MNNIPYILTQLKNEVEEFTIGNMNELIWIKYLGDNLTTYNESYWKTLPFWYYKRLIFHETKDYSGPIAFANYKVRRYHITKRSNGKYIEIYCEIDSEYLNALPENLKTLEIFNQLQVYIDAVNEKGGNHVDGK